MRRILGTRRSLAPLASAILVLMTHAIWGLVPRPASGQSVAPGAAVALAPGATRPASSIPAPTRFQPSDPVPSDRRSPVRRKGRKLAAH